MSNCENTEAGPSQSIGPANPVEPLQNSGHIEKEIRNEKPPPVDAGNKTDSHTQLGLDNQIARAIQHRDELQKQCQLEDINNEIDTLQHRADNKPILIPPPMPIGVNSETGAKRPSDKTLLRASKRRNIKPEKLSDYYGKSRREHCEWVRDADVAFALTPWNFQGDMERIIWAMQALKSDLKEQWHNKCARDPVVTQSWDYFVTFLLDKIEDLINRQLDVNQEFTDARQRHS